MRDLRNAALTLLLAASLAIAAARSVYPASAVVTSIKDDTVSFETATGHVYEMTGAEDWATGDIAALIMFNSGTPRVMDDIILKARYSGFWFE